MQKVVFFDIDGTIWDEMCNIPESTKIAIAKLKENGHKAILCSGRARGNIRNPHLLGLGFDGVIASCGNHVELDGKVVYEKILCKDHVKQIIDVCKENHMPIVLEGPKKHWVDGDGFEGDPYIDNMLADLKDDVVVLDGYCEDIYVNKFSAAIIKDTNFNAIKEILEKDFDFLMHEGDVLECIPAGTSKATGIEWLCNYLGIDKEHTYAIGDSVNDLDMLQYVGHGICMGNGSSFVKEIAEYVTTDIHEDGIYNALAQYGLI